MATHPVGQFSGGEKARLTLALLVRRKPNLLLLDEPTNHLDIEMREALAEALQDYDGALVVVAHDRHLLRATTDALWLVADGRVVPFDGDLDDYRDWVLARSRRPAESADAGTTGKRKAQKRAEAEARQRDYAQKKPLADKRARIEREMDALDAERKAIEEWLASPAAYAESGKEALKERIARQGDLAWQLARLETEWLEVSEALEDPRSTA
jgi:ATP-binding cassette subfamily F protein 3